MNLRLMLVVMVGFIVFHSEDGVECGPYGYRGMSMLPLTLI